ncbi:MAG: hypothetical protein ACREDR_04765 [Blastocatellia bacterium]
MSKTRLPKIVRKVYHPENEISSWKKQAKQVNPSRTDPPDYRLFKPRVNQGTV